MRRPLVDPTPRVVGDSGLLAASLLVAGLSGAAVALLLTLAAGSGERTDAVLAAYSLYVVAALFAATARSSLVPLFGATRPEGEFRARAADVASRMALAGALAGVGLALAAPLLAPLLTGALGPRARETALAAVLLFAPCAWLQMRAAAMSALLSAATRFRVSALAYGAAGLCSVAVTAPALLLAGPLGAPLGILAGSLALSAAHSRYLRTFGLRVRGRSRWVGERRQWRLTASLATTASLPLAFQAWLAIALASVGAKPGEITVYSYAYFLVLLVVTMTSIAASVTTQSSLVARLADGGPGAAGTYVTRVAVPVLAVAIPLLVTVSALGQPLIEWVFRGSMTAGQIAQLHTLVLALVPLALALALAYLLVPVVLAVGRQVRLVPLALGATAFVLAGTLLVRRDTLAVALVHSAAGVLVTPPLAALALGRRWPGTLARVASASLPALALAAPLAALGLAIGPDAPAWAAGLAAVSGLGFYGVAGARLWPGVVGRLPLARRLRRGR